MPDGLKTKFETHWEVSLYDLLKAYGDITRRKEYNTYELPTFNILSMEDAATNLAKMLGNLPRSGPHSVWTTLQSFIPEGITDPLLVRSTVASTFTAGLEMAKQGKLEIRQDGAFKPVYLRTADREPGFVEEKEEESNHGTTTH